MDIVGTSIGFFTTAFKAYQKIAKAIDVNSKRSKWSVLMRIERARFEAWGLVLGFLDTESGNPKNEGTIKSEVMAELNDILQVEKIGVLVQDILKSITDSLQEFEKSAKKYRLVVSDAENSSHKSEAIHKLVNQTKDFSIHLAMTINDEKMVEDLLNNLKDLNDGLENVLSLSQKTRVEKALSSGVLPEYRTTAEIDGFLNVLTRHSIVAGDMNPNTTNLRYPALLATANVKYHCVEMPTPNSISDETTVLRQPLDYEISVKNLQIKEAPMRAAEDLLWPSDIVVFNSDDNRKFFHVLVEWRQPEPISRGTYIPAEELTLRRNMLVQLLHETSNGPNAADYRVLDCLGYCRSKGRDEADQSIPIIGFVSKIPDWADGRKQPTTLYKLLENSFRSNDPKLTPSLSARFQLARQLATALYQLQCSQWLHRNLSSHQVVFFYDKTTGTLRFEEPFLIGLQYSRPDDQSSNLICSIVSECIWDVPRIRQNNWGSLALYLHPDFSKERRRYRRSDDIYSIGMILSEIAFWEPVDPFHDDTESIYDIARRAVETVRIKLSGQVGDIYRNAVVHCLEGLRQSVPEQRQEDVDQEEAYTGKYRGEDPEIGLEADFLRMVLNEIAKCRV